MLQVFCIFVLRRISCQKFIYRYDAIISDVVSHGNICMETKLDAVPSPKIFLPSRKQPLGFEPTRRSLQVLLIAITFARISLAQLQQSIGLSITFCHQCAFELRKSRRRSPTWLHFRPPSLLASACGHLTHEELKYKNIIETRSV